MEKEVKLFDKRFVHFMWNDELEGKECFVADNINSLIERVEKGASIYKVRWSRDNGMPFESDDLVRYRFAYYDENYSIKKAFNEGETIQYQLVDGVSWAGINSKEALECRIAEGRTFRIKPKEDEKWIAYLVRQTNGVCYLAACRVDRWEFVQKTYGAKTQLFIGTEDEAVEWYKTRQKFAEVIKAWEDGKTIQYYCTLRKEWRVCFDGEPLWDVDCAYRAKPQIGQIELITTANPLQEEDGWYFCDGREMPKEFIGNKAVEELINTYGTPGSMRLPDMRPKRYAIYLGEPNSSPLREDGKKEYRPYESSAEMIADFIDRFKVNCPSYCEPLIWLSLKEDERNRFLVTGFHEDSIEITKQPAPMDMSCVFKKFVFLDGGPVGMEVKE